MNRYIIPLVVTVTTLALLTGCGGGTGIQTTSANSTPVPNSPASSPSPAPDPSPSPAPPPNGQTFTNIHQNNEWLGYGELPSGYSICQSCLPSGPDVSWSMTRGVSSPSLSGNSTETTIGGDKPYSDVLWVNHLIGAYSSEGVPDSEKKLVPTLHNFTYDVYFYSGHPELAQAIEFDVNQYFDSKGYIWGHQCRVAGGNEWDTWDNVHSKWISTGIACHPLANSWNHVVIQVQRTSDDQLLYQSISLNGETSQVNVKRPPGTAPSNWYGITVNYQLDGNLHQQPYSVWLDKFNFTYW